MHHMPEEYKNKICEDIIQKQLSHQCHNCFQFEITLHQYMYCDI